jgi:hypothetical protein
MSRAFQSIPYGSLKKEEVALTSHWRFVKRITNLMRMIKMESILTSKKNNWWCWEKIEVEVCPVLS